MSELSPDVPSRAAHKLFETYHNIGPEEVNDCLDDLISAGIWYDEPRGRWLISRYDHARAALTHPHLLNNLQLARQSTKSWGLSQRLGTGAVPMLFLDPPSHDVVRAAFSPLFSPFQIQQLSPWIAQEAERIVASVRLQQEFDLATDLAQPFAVSLILRTFGLTSQANDSVRELVNDLFAFNRLFDLTCSPEELEAGQSAGRRIRSKVESELLMVSGIESLGQRLNVSRDLLSASLEFSLRAGVVTTSCLLVNILIRLFSRLSQYSVDSVERSIAACGPALEAGRVSASSVKIDEFTIPANETVICLLPAANRDLELRGGPVRGHLTFGAGRHRCLGEHLVREAAQSLVAVMERERLSIELLGGNEYHYTPSFRGLRRSPVRWTAR